MNAAAQKIDTARVTTTEEALIARIELRPLKDKSGEALRGSREVVVDGKVWGHIEQHSGGRYRSYRLLQCHGSSFHWIERKVSKGGYAYYVEFRSTRPDRYDRAINKAKAVPLDDQFRNWIATVIAEGKLRDPADVVAETKRENEEYRRQRQAEIAVENQAFFERAAACLDPIAGDLGDNVKAEVVAQIIAAMRWAQTK